ncbi:MAG TPA: RtcB family protein [Longimicrobium sp.]|jgi:hypothetical protein|nr:RtcB family protein [Longimicrobium sp.]
MKIFGEHQENTIRQLQDVASRADRVALMADGHVGYVMPIGGVAGYRDRVSVVGVGFDIGCGNCAIRTDLRVGDVTRGLELDEIRRNPHRLISDRRANRAADELQSTISFGIGRKNEADDAPVDHPLFIDPAWYAIPNTGGYRDTLREKARRQLGTVGSGNHYVDVFADETGAVWVGVHFGSRGFGHTVASDFLSLSQGGRWGERAREKEVLLDVRDGIGHDYWQLMELAGRYAYAGREWVARKVVELLGGTEQEIVHNHHNFAWRETHLSPEGEPVEYVVVRKGATPAFPGQKGFVGGSMGDDAVIIAGAAAPEGSELAALQRDALFTGVARVVCEEKHMGSRAVVVVCRDEAAARRRFGVEGEGIGIVYTRTGRRFFTDAALEAEVLTTVGGAIGAAGLWEELETDWVVLDCELMPWSAKAQELVRDQYAAVGAAARGALDEAVAVLERAAGRGTPVGELLARHHERRRLVEAYAAAYRRYCWPVESMADLRLAPFHLLATEGAVHAGRDHLWHLEMISRIRSAADGLLFLTGHRVVELDDAASEAAATAWWEEMTEAGGEGMVVKPLEFVANGRRGLVQPAVKCRGREYLRIIYGPEYTDPANLERLRQRGLGAKRSLALREFALGIEALERFVRGEPLRRVHECVFGVLAMESEPVDPRL